MVVREYEDQRILENQTAKKRDPICGETLSKKLYELMRKMVKIPEEWKIRIIVPISNQRVAHYVKTRGITLLNVEHKVMTGP